MNITILNNKEENKEKYPFLIIFKDGEYSTKIRWRGCTPIKEIVERYKRFLLENREKKDEQEVVEKEI